MKGFIELNFKRKTTTYIDVNHVSSLTNEGGLGTITLFGGEKVETELSFPKLIEKYHEQRVLKNTIYYKPSLT